VAKKYTPNEKNYSLFDLMQEGTTFLYRAIDKFRLEKKCRFSFYAQYWLRTESNRFVKNSTKRENATVSLDAPIREGSIDPLVDFMADDKIPDPEKVAQESELEKRATQVLSKLKPREERILRMRCNDVSLEEIGGKFSVSRQRIERVEKRAISKLRKGKKREMLQGFI